MSGYLSGLVLLVGPTERIQRNVLFAISDSADDDTGYCWPSVQTLANKTLFSTRYVIEAVNQLERDRWMSVEHRAVKGRYTAYTVDVEKLETLRRGQKELEKLRKRSGANVSQETYIADLRKLHESHMNRVHLRSENDSQLSHEQSSPQIPQSSGEQSSRQIDQPQVNSFASDVNSFAVSGEIRSTPINVVKHHETSHERESAPSSRDEFPEGLSDLKYAGAIMERRTLSGANHMMRLLAETINHIAKLDSLPLNRAAQLLETRISAAQDEGEAVTPFWITDQKWKPQHRHHRSTQRDVMSQPMRVVVPTQEEIDAEERSAFETWQSMNDNYKRVNPWKGRAFA
jgi:hypothetical protein